MIDIVFYVLAAVAIGSSFGVVVAKNPVGSLLFAVTTLGSLAGVFVLLEAHFLAAIQIIVYAGAIMVLFLFVIMLLNLGHDYQADLRGGAWIVVAFAVAGTVGWVVWQSFGTPGAVVQREGAARIAASVEQLNAVGAVAQPLFSHYLVPFELVGILLLVAIIGAVLLAKRRV